MYRMRSINLIVVALLLSLSAQCQSIKSAPASAYLSNVQQELKAVFPNNKRINLVFHGHSVPSGYWSKQEVHTLESYPHLLLTKLKKEYPHAVINVIVTAIGGEFAEKGQPRLATEVLPHKPDVLFIDYALNDMGIGLERSRVAWEKMIEEALRHDIKVILVTPSPDQRQDLKDPDNKLAQHARQIRELAARYKVGLADPYAEFERIAKEEGTVTPYMSHVNHPNEKGHDIIARELLKHFL